MIRYLTALLFLTLNASSAFAASETCVASAPNGNSLRVYDAPTTNGPVIGGIGVGTCGITVTNQCEGTMCVIALPGLNGWADMRHISNSPVQAPGLAAPQSVTGSYVYAVTGGSGTVTAAGVTQPTPVDATGTVTVERSSARSATLILPREVTDAPVALTGDGSGPWQGGFGSWGGMPMSVTVRFDGLGMQTAVLVLQGQNQMASMKISLDLSAQRLPDVAQTGAGTAGTAPEPVPIPPPSPQGSGPNACVELEKITKIINAQAGTRQIQDMRGIYVLAGVKSTEPTADQAACERALDLIAQDGGLWELAENGGYGGPGVSQQGGQQVPRERPSGTQGTQAQAQQEVPGSTQAPASASPDNGRLATRACSILQPQVSALLRGQSRADREATLDILSAQGVVSVSSANPSQCALVMVELIAVGLIPNDNRPWTTIAQMQAGTGVPGGEDPATMIAGGVEIGIDPSDFIPEFDPSGQQSASTTPAANGGTGASVPAAVPSANDPCILLGNAMVIAIRLGFSRDLDAFSEVLKRHSVENLEPSSAQACVGALAEARQQGLAR